MARVSFTVLYVFARNPYLTGVSASWDGCGRCLAIQQSASEWRQGGRTGQRTTAAHPARTEQPADRNSGYRGGCCNWHCRAIADSIMRWNFAKEVSEARRWCVKRASCLPAREIGSWKHKRFEAKVVRDSIERSSLGIIDSSGAAMTFSNSNDGDPR